MGAYGATDLREWQRQIIGTCSDPGEAERDTGVLPIICGDYGRFYTAR
jgi:hypothetical protein